MLTPAYFLASVKAMMFCLYTPTFLDQAKTNLLMVIEILSAGESFLNVREGRQESQQDLNVSEVVRTAGVPSTGALGN